MITYVLNEIFLKNFFVLINTLYNLNHLSKGFVTRFVGLYNLEVRPIAFTIDFY